MNFKRRRNKIRYNDHSENGNHMARKSLTELLELLHNHLPEFRQRYAVSSLAVFGSYTRHEQGKLSDLDILVEFEETPSLIRFIKFENELTALLDVKVDLVMKTALKPSIGARILRDAIQVPA